MQHLFLETALVALAACESLCNFNPSNQLSDQPSMTPLPLVTSQFATQRSCKLRCNSLCQVTCKLGRKGKLGGLLARGSPAVQRDPFFSQASDKWKLRAAVSHSFSNLLAWPTQEMESDGRRFTVHWHKAQTNACNGCQLLMWRGDHLQSCSELLWERRIFLVKSSRSF